MEIINSIDQDCIDYLHDLSQICLECSNHSLYALDYRKRQGLIRILSECSQLAGLTADFIITKAAFRKDLALLCAQVIFEAKAQCDKFSDEITTLTGQVCMETHAVLIERFKDNYD